MWLLRKYVPITRHAATLKILDSRREGKFTFKNDWLDGWAELRVNYQQSRRIHSAQHTLLYAAVACKE
jgi:hypothetical protein